MIPDFAKVLSDYIHEKNVNVYSMAQFCDLDRSTMYKFINGKRRPSSISLVRKMADFMLLTPAEYQLLSEAYRISLVGPEIYFRRKYIWKFLQNPGKYISALPVNFTKTGVFFDECQRFLKIGFDLTFLLPLEELRAGCHNFRNTSWTISSAKKPETNFSAKRINIGAYSV